MNIEEIETERVIPAARFVLRPLRRSDQGLVEMYASDERVARMTTSIPHPLPPGSIQQFIEASLQDAREEDVWVMDGSAQGSAEVLGLIGLKPMDRNQSEIGYWVAPAFWNTGIASDAVRAMVEANPQGVDTMFGSVFQDNPGSARVLTNCGFEYLGDAEAFSVARQAKVDTWTYLKKMK
ncbi:MAG: GNAT family N-acetyltransferase [Pseudomonadota bacterium]